MPSDASSGRRDPPEKPQLTFFLDRQIGKYVVADALRKVGAKVEVHDDHFPQETEDRVWIPFVGEKRWILVSRDQNIRRNVLEREAYKAAAIRGFILTGKGGGPELAKLLVECLPLMERRVGASAGPLLYTISRGGAVSSSFAALTSHPYRRTRSRARQKRI